MAVDGSSGIVSCIYLGRLSYPAVLEFNKLTNMDMRKYFTRKKGKASSLLQQTLDFNNILKQTQDQHNKTRTQNEIDTDNINKILAQEKKERDIAMHEKWAQQEKHELEFTNNHDFMTENPQTEVSMLAPHRVKPYHFKGLNQDQIDQINLERKMQVREAEMIKD